MNVSVYIVILHTLVKQVQMTYCDDYCTSYVSSSLFLVQSSVGIKAQVQIIESS